MAHSFTAWREGLLLSGNSAPTDVFTQPLLPVINELSACVRGNNWRFTSETYVQRMWLRGGINPWRRFLVKNLRLALIWGAALYKLEYYDCFRFPTLIVIGYFLNEGKKGGKKLSVKFQEHGKWVGTRCISAFAKLFNMFFFPSLQ